MAETTSPITAIFALRKRIGAPDIFPDPPNITRMMFSVTWSQIGIAVSALFAFRGCKHEAEQMELLKKAFRRIYTHKFYKCQVNIANKIYRFDIVELS